MQCLDSIYSEVQKQFYKHIFYGCNLETLQPDQSKL